MNLMTFCKRRKNLNVEHINSDIINFNDKNRSNDSIFLNPISSEEISKFIDMIKNYDSFYEYGFDRL